VICREELPQSAFSEFQRLRENYAWACARGVRRIAHGGMYPCLPGVLAGSFAGVPGTHDRDAGGRPGFCPLAPAPLLRLVIPRPSRTASVACHGALRTVAARVYYISLCPLHAGSTVMSLPGPSTRANENDRRPVEPCAKPPSSQGAFPSARSGTCGHLQGRGCKARPHTRAGAGRWDHLSLVRICYANESR
jgi:hypothetical protein